MPIKLISFVLFVGALASCAYLHSITPLFLGFAFWIPVAFIAYLLHQESINDEDSEMR